MSRFYVPKENVKNGKIIIDGEEAHHVLDVMRLEDDDKVVVFDGTGNEYTGFIKDTDRKSKRIVVEVVRTETPSLESTSEITLSQAIPKKNKMSYVVEKATELGVKRVIPLITERTIVRPDKASCARKVQRWRKTATQSSKQCGRSDIPEITEITSYKDMAESLDGYDLVLFAHLAKETISIKEAITGFKAGKILLFIGPEGDFTPEEVKLLRKDNVRFISLGRRVLRSDTAGLFALSVLSYEFSF